MEEKYVIECRYETLSLNGKYFIPWFVCNSNPFDENEAKLVIKNLKDNFKFIDTKTKLKHEYRLKSYTEYQNSIKQMIKNNKELEDKQKKYFKSDEYKELQKKKRIAKKELKERQKKYLEEHKKTES